MFCSITEQQNGLFCCIVDGDPCRNFWKQFLFDFIVHMLITYGHNLNQINYVNNIYNNLINKLHLNLRSGTIFDQWKLFKNDQKCLFGLKSSFRSQYLFLMTSWSYRKSNYIRKIRLISKSMRSQRGQKTIATHLFPNMSRSKGNHVMKFGQLIGYNTRKIFVEKLYTKCGGETIPWSWCKKWKFSISLNQLRKILKFVCILW